MRRKATQVPPAEPIMRNCGWFTPLAAVLLASSVAGQDSGGVGRFPLETSGATAGLGLTGPVRPGAYVSDVGRRAAVFGDETGAFEVWVWPLKLVRDLRLAFRIPEYDEPIAGATVATRVTTRPEGLTITYTHATFTVRQHVFVPMQEPGALMLLDVETVRPLDVLVQLHADFDLAWPGGFGGGTISWQEREKRFLLTQGGVRLYNGFIGSPFATTGTLHPAHDAPLIASRFLLRFDPATTTSSYIPVAIAGGAASRDSVDAAYHRILAGAERYWREKVEHYRSVSEDQLKLVSSEPALDLALEWAKINLDQQLACNPDLGCGLVAGFGRAGAGNFRPGFGWYFGGDAAINSFGMDGLGQFELVRQGLTFLRNYQREDGKIPHEISHAAKRLPWFTDYPYTFFHGDTTPFWMLACVEYWRASGDNGFLRESWPSIVKAFRWSAATDRDGDGLMENPAAGAGAIEVGGLGEGLLTDIYLAGVWVAALQGLGEMAAAAGDRALQAETTRLFDKARASLEGQFWLEPAGIYAFALLQGTAPGAPGPRNDALTVWPATAMTFGVLNEERAQRMLREIASSVITTDWGVRTLSSEHRLYDPLHYNNGTVWGFVTGFGALAHYRYHRSWSGYDLMRDVVRSTFDFARGRSPELMSGAFYRTLDTTVPQQFFATSMIAAPLVRGLLGLRANAPARRVEIEPHLPAHWDSAVAHNFRIADDKLTVRVRRSEDRVTIQITRTGARTPLTLRVAPALPLGAEVTEVLVSGRPVTPSIARTAHDVHAAVELTLIDTASVDVRFEGGVEIVPPDENLTVGQRSEGLRVLDLRGDGNEFVVVIEGRAGRDYTLELRTSRPERVRLSEDHATSERSARGIRFRVRTGDGEDRYVRREIRFTM